MEVEEKLLKEIASKKTEYRTDNYPMSIGEISNLYKNNELILRPEFQRLFRWTHGQRVKLIESIMLGIPIPSVFVFQNEDGKWEVVDGLQRISTILQFMGLLEGEEQLILTATKYLPSLDGYKYSEEDEGEGLILPSSVRLNFKRAKINLTIILSESGEKAKFDVFQRLNTGGSSASNQEVRNSIMQMLNPTISTWLTQLSETESFLNTISISDRLRDEQYHIELALRFIALTQYKYDSRKDVGDFLDEVNEKLLTEDVNIAEIESIFTSTFSLLDSALGEKVFKRYNPTKDDFQGKFLESAFEAISVGVSSNIEQYLGTDKNQELIERIKELHSQQFYVNNSGSGSNAKSRIPRIVEAAKDFFKLK